MYIDFNLETLHTIGNRDGTEANPAMFFILSVCHNCCHGNIKSSADFLEVKDLPADFFPDASLLSC